jgi:hypothetical protein
MNDTQAVFLLGILIGLIGMFVLPIGAVWLSNRPRRRGKP